MLPRSLPFTAALLIVFAPLALAAQTKARSHPRVTLGKAPACNEEGSMPEVTTCAANKAEAADAKRAAALHALLSSVSDEPALVRKLQTMERNWIAYRDSFLAAAYPYPSAHGDPGSLMWIRKYEAEEEMNREHVAALKELQKSLTIP